MTVCQQGTLLLVTLCILSLWLTSTLLGCYEEEGDGAPPHHEGVGETTPMSSPGEARAKEVGTQYYDTLNIDEEYQQKLKGEGCCETVCISTQLAHSSTNLEFLLFYCFSECHLFLPLTPPLAQTLSCGFSLKWSLFLSSQAVLSMHPLQRSCLAPPTSTLPLLVASIFPSTATSLPSCSRTFLRKCRLLCQGQAVLWLHSWELALEAPPLTVAWPTHSQDCSSEGKSGLKLLYVIVSFLPHAIRHSPAT